MNNLQFGISVTLAIITIGGVFYNIVKTHVLTHNHINHLAKDVKQINKKLEGIDNTQKKYGIELAKVQATCVERGKQIEKLT